MGSEREDHGAGCSAGHLSRPRSGVCVGGGCGTDAGGPPSISPLHPASGRDPFGKLAPQSCQQGTCSYAQPSYLKLLLMALPSKLAQALQQGTDCRAIDLVALWSPQLAHPLIHPTSHRVPYREKGKLPAAFIHLEASSGFHTATSRNTLDLLNPGCVNSPDPLNSQGCSLMSNGSSVPSFLAHHGATWGTRGG